MNMKLSKQVLIVVLCCLLVQFSAQADSYGPTSQSNEQSPAPPVQQSIQELQQLVATSSGPPPSNRPTLSHSDLNVVYVPAL
jgi:hypothetical protein